MKSVFLHDHTHKKSVIHGMDARPKIILCFSSVVICTTTPVWGYAAFIGYMGLILSAMILSKIPITFYLKRSLVVIPFVILAAVFLPFIRRESDPLGMITVLGRINIYLSGLRQFGGIAVKAFTSVLAIIILSATTPFPALLEGLEGLRFPALLVMLIGFTYRYMFVLLEELTTMKQAIDSRGYRGKWLWQAGVFGRIIGVLFLRSYERSERIYFAMISRGFGGRLHFSPPLKMPLSGYLTIAAGILYLLLLRLVIL